MDEVVCVSILDENLTDKIKGAKRIKIIGDSSKLENNLFRGNKLLEYVEISENIEEIGESCFQGCSNLKEVILPDDLEKIGDYCFHGCSSLEKIEIPDGVVEISDYAFCGCHFLDRLVLPDSVTRIGDYCFSYCTNLKEIKLPSNLKVISGYAFSGCESLKGVTIPNGVLEIGHSAFFDCSSLESLVMSDSVIRMGSFCFYDCNSLKEVKLSTNLEHIGENAFSYCTSLKSITIPDSILEIESGIFLHCENLQSIKLPINLKVIDDYAFCVCESLKSITIPDSVLKIGYNSFSHCHSLESLIISDKSNLKRIGESSFLDCTSLRNIFIPDTVVELDYSAFSKCNSLEEIDLPDGINTLNKRCFESCENLRIIKLFSSLHSIDNTVFDKCNKIERIIICYDLYEKLVNFINNSKKFFRNDKFYKKIYFSGPELSVIQKTTIQILCKLNVSFVKDNKNISKEFSNSGDDVSNIINEINMLCDKLPEELKNTIDKKVNDLLVKYSEDKEILKPSFGIKKPVLSFGDISVNELKPKLLSELDMIKLSLTTKSDIINFISKLELCSNLLDKKTDELLDDHDSIEDMVWNIMYYSKYLDNDKRNNYINKIRGFIKKAMDSCSREFTDSNNELKLNDELDVKLDFRLKLTNIYNEIEGYTSNIIPFKNLSMALKSNDERDNVGDDIVSLLECIRYVINCLSNEKYKYDLNVCYSNILDKYSKKVDNLLKKPDTLDELKYEGVENELRDVLQSLLKVIRKYDYELKKNNNLNLSSTLNSCLDIIQSGELVSINEEDKRDVLVYTIKELNNSIVCNNDIDKSDIINELIEIINKYLNIIQKDEINTIEKYKEIQKDILGELMLFKINFSMFIDDVNNYKKLIK